MFLKSKRKPHQKAEKYSPSLKNVPPDLSPSPCCSLFWASCGKRFLGSLVAAASVLCATQQPSLVSGSLGGPRRPFLFAVLTIRGDYFLIMSFAP